MSVRPMRPPAPATTSRMSDIGSLPATSYYVAGITARRSEGKQAGPRTGTSTAGCDGALHAGLLDRAGDKARRDHRPGEVLHEGGSRRAVLGVADGERVATVVAGQDARARQLRLIGQEGIAQV